MFRFIAAFVLTIISITVKAHGISDHVKQSFIEANYFEYIWLGVEHMLTGYDHLLFLLGVIFLLNNTKDIIRVISIFTIGHCLTLIFATYFGISANYWLIDAVIALSVCYKGFDNIQGFVNYFKWKKSPNILLMILIFGLIHGFGLSTRLQQLPLGHASSDMILRILSFNLGVEFGQIIALIIMLFLLKPFRKRKGFSNFAKIANHGLILAGFLLFLMQMHGYFHTSSPEEFKPSKEDTTRIEKHQHSLPQGPKQDH